MTPLKIIPDVRQAVVRMVLIHEGTGRLQRGNPAAGYSKRLL